MKEDENEESQQIKEIQAETEKNENDIKGNPNETTLIKSDNISNFKV